MKRKLHIEVSGAQSRKLDGSFVVYNKSNPYPCRKLGKQILVSRPPEDLPWEHPWKTRLKYYTNLKMFDGTEFSGFGAKVSPGFVNGLDPVAVAAYSENPTPVERQGVFKNAPGLMDDPIIPIIDLTEEGKPVAATFLNVTTGPMAEAALGNQFFRPSEGEVIDEKGYPTGIILDIPAPIKAIYKSASEGGMPNPGALMVSFVYVRMPVSAEVSMPIAKDLSHFALMSMGLIGATATMAVEGMRLGLPTSRTFTGGSTVTKWRDRPQIMFGVSGLTGRETIFSNHVLAEVYLVGGNGGAPTTGIPFVRHRCFWNLQFRMNNTLGSTASYQWFT
jgi:hypothetical protein